MLAEVLTQVAIVIGFVLPVATGVFIGRERLSQTVSELRPRLRTSAPALLLLGSVLVLNRYMRQNEPNVGFYMTETIRSIEGEFVLIFQDIATPLLTEYFTASYIYGYTFLLLFTPLAYFALSDTTMFRRLLTAYSLNYALGVVLYVLVIAYGPRNILPEFVAETMLYDNNPKYQYLTGEVNRNTNVFPSLHTSLSATVGIFAYYTRDEYPKWFPVAVFIAISVIISTMYLAIHWGTDVFFGLVLASVCVALSNMLVGRWSLTDLFDRLDDDSLDTVRDRLGR
ncbi:inositol phosphorylceramide synthase [Haloterrigena salifodinae]|uniref:Inositol phosphorylceramide synthase n=1 Tax=Haloterrigena salifodinae TaxID=2675099 RepID=A0A8T8E3L2_9EURY|nr:phosphatase PAP2 family protein [Haloterrigena salifodinae]QRV15981.1 inositol phosphorylceramide synthase [Haloterrigena salifodinae]